MRIKIIEFEGAPEELTAVPELREQLRQDHALRSRGKQPKPPLDIGPEDESALAELPEEVSQALRTRARSLTNLRLLIRFCQRFLSLPNARLEVGTSSGSKDGLAWMIHGRRSDGRRAGFLRLDARRAQVIFGLDESVLDNCEHAFARKVRPGDKWRVKIALEENALDEASDLAKEAYENAS